jgi:ATP-dependent RNA helicase DHX57
VKFLLPGKVETVVFQMLTPPSIDAVRTALRSLEDLNALDKAKTLTPLGLHLARMPVDAQVGKLLIFACMLKYLDPILTIAASLSAKSPFVSPMERHEEAAGAWLKFAGNSKRDHMVVVVAYNGWLNARQNEWDAESNYLSGNFLLREVQILADLGFVPGFEDREHGKGQSVEDSLRTNANSVRVVKALICAGFYPNIVHVHFNRMLEL